MTVTCDDVVASGPKPQGCVPWRALRLPKQLNSVTDTVIETVSH
jgi:hypothetical protein